MENLPTRLCLRNKNLHCFRACLRTPTRTVKYQVVSLRGFIRSSLEYIMLVSCWSFKKKRCSSVNTAGFIDILPSNLFSNLNNSIKHRQTGGHCVRFALHKWFSIAVGCRFAWCRIRWFQHSRDSLKGSGSTDSVRWAQALQELLGATHRWIVGMLALGCRMLPTLDD